jgi:hypothetical protein
MHKTHRGRATCFSTGHDSGDTCDSGDRGDIAVFVSGKKIFLYLVSTTLSAVISRLALDEDASFSSKNTITHPPPPPVPWIWLGIFEHFEKDLKSPR